MGPLTPPFSSFDKENKISSPNRSTTKRTSNQIENREDETASSLAEKKRLKTLTLWGESNTTAAGIPSNQINNSGWNNLKLLESEKKKAPGGWGKRKSKVIKCTGCDNWKCRHCTYQPSEEEHEEKSYHLLEYCKRSIPVEPWEVVNEAIDPETEADISIRSEHTWVAGLLYINQQQIPHRLHHKFIIQNRRYKLNPSQYRQTYHYQKAGRRSQRDTDWFIPKFKTPLESRPLWRKNSVWLPYRNWIDKTYNTLLHHPKTIILEPVLQHILSYFFWRPSNIPSYFSSEYKEDIYWKGKFSHLEAPKTPTHLVRFKGIDPVPRILKTATEIVRTLEIGTIPRRQRHWLRHAPNPERWFADLTRPYPEISIPSGTYQVFTPAGPGPWRNQYQYYKTFELVPTSNRPRVDLESRNTWI